MMLSPVEILALFVLALALLGVARLSAVQRALRLRLEQVERAHAELGELVVSLQNALHHVYHDGHEARERDHELEERVAMLSRQQDQLLLRDADVGPYFQAIRHAERGCGVVELIDRTGVSRGEAELIVALHGKAAASAQGATQLVGQVRD